MIQLRDYQLKGIEDIKAAMRAGSRSILFQLCTGGGKTAMAASMISGTQSKGLTTFFTVHRKDLLLQTSMAFQEFDIPHTYIAAEHDFNPYGKNFICSIDTLKKRITTVPVPAIIHVDEAHLSNSDGWHGVISYFMQKGARVVGYTATPWRLDGTGLKRNFQSMVQGPSMLWLIDNKYLNEFYYFSPTTLDLSGIKTSMGDYNKHDLNIRMIKDGVRIADAIKYYLRHARGKRAICYCVSIEDSENIAARFRAAGIRAQHVDGETPMLERRRIIAMFANGEIDILCNVDLITTGFDLAAQVGRDVTVQAIILMRPTKSLTLFLQMVGRGLRPQADGSYSIILDHANCRKNHGFPDDEREWSLEDRKKISLDALERTLPIRTCSKCGLTHRPAPKCPFCGFIYPINYREIDELDGELFEITPEQRRAKKKEAVAEAHTIEELIAEGQRQGMNDPVGWAAKVFTGRKIAHRKHKRGGIL